MTTTESREAVAHPVTTVHAVTATKPHAVPGAQSDRMSGVLLVGVRLAVDLLAVDLLVGVRREPAPNAPAEPTAVLVPTAEVAAIAPAHPDPRAVPLARVLPAAHPARAVPTRGVSASRS